MKKIFITIIAMLLPLMASADANGTCGENLTWSYVETTKTLTISGTGEMTNYYTYSNVPWNSFKSSIKKIIIKSGVTSVGYYAFDGCSGLTSVTIPNSVTSIGSYAFCYCSGLTSITIPNSVTNIGEYAFDYCYGLTSVYITDLEAWCKIDFYGYDSNPVKYAKHLFLNGEEIKDLVIPNNLTSIKNSAFSGCSSLTSVTIPNSVTSIGSSAFSGCSGLTTVTIPNSVTSIGSSAFDGTGWYNNQPDGLVYAGNVAYKYKGTMPSNTSISIKDGTLGIAGSAFSGCSGLTSVTIPNSVTSIGDGAFWYCSGLTSVTIPQSVTSIRDYSFSYCSGLTSIVSLNNTPLTLYDSYDFYYVDKANCIVWVPRGSANAYKDADGWKDFQNIRELALGDVNIDFEVNQADLDATTDHIMGKDQEGFYENLADLNSDEAVNAADVVKLVTILNIQDGLSLDWDYSYNSSQMVSSLSCTLNNDGDKTIQLTKCELYNNNKLVMGSNFKVTLAPGESKSRTFSDLEGLSAKTGFSVVWYYTYNGESYTYNCDLTE